MKITEIINKCELEQILLCSDYEVKTGYCSDLMSDVMAHAKPDSVWITIQSHKNSIAVAIIKDINTIIFTNDVTIEPEVITKAREESINLLRTKKDSFTVCGEIYCMLEAKTESN